MTESQVMRRDLALIFAVWLMALFVLAIGTVSKSPISLLWPMGNDVDWSLILKQGIGAKAAEQEFSFDHRNPLSGWAYSAVAPLILGHQYGFHLVRLLSCLMLGISVFLLAHRFGRGRRSLFPVMLGSIVSVWWFWSNFTQVVWIMLFALALSMLTVWSYCVYVDSGRTRGIFYAWSLSLWLIALGTYTIQCGAIFAVGLIALLRGSERGFRVAIRDLLPYGVVAVCFLFLWIAAARGFFIDPSVSATTGLQISAGAFLHSIEYLFWHPSFSSLLWALSYHPWLIATAVVFTTLVALAIFFLYRKVEMADRRTLGWVLATAGCLAVPTVLLESTSPTWAPGLRSDMLFAAFVPTVYLSLAGLLFSFLPRKASNAATAVFAFVMGTTVVEATLEQLREGTEAMNWQKHLAKVLLPFRTKLPPRFILSSSTGA
jgi:hypothetical protein